MLHAQQQLLELVAAERLEQQIGEVLRDVEVGLVGEQEQREEEAVAEARESMHSGTRTLNSVTVTHCRCEFESVLCVSVWIRSDCVCDLGTLVDSCCTLQAEL